MLVMKRLEGESWRDCAKRYAEQHGLVEEVETAFEHYLMTSPDPEMSEGRAVWLALYEWDLLDDV